MYEQYVLHACMYVTQNVKKNTKSIFGVFTYKVTYRDIFALLQLHAFGISEDLFNMSRLHFGLMNLTFEPTGLIFNTSIVR